MKKEMNIVELIKKVRFSYSMLKHLMSRKEIRLMKFSQKSVIDIDKESESQKSCATDEEYMDQFEEQYN